MCRLINFCNVALLLCSVSLPVLAAQPVPPTPPPPEAKPAAASPADSAEPADGVGPRESAKPSPVARPKRRAPDAPATSATPAADPRLPQAKGPIELRETKDPVSGKAVLVISNDDLTRIYGRSTAAAAVSAPDSTSRDAVGAQPGAAAPAPDPAARIAQVEQDLARLRSNAMRLHNPLLGAPVQSEEEKEKMRGDDNAQRLAQTQSQIDQLEAELASLRGATGTSQDPKR
ncbi:MAG: hypothetical protein U0V87_16125 [Acidobacteriota bacterium]